MYSFREAVALLTRMRRVAKHRQLTLLAAGVAFYAFFSLVPLALLGIVVATVAGGEGLAARVTESVSDVLTPSAQSLLAEAITEESGRGGATVVGTVGLLWTGSRVLRGLDRTFSEVYGTVAATTVLRSFRNAGIVAVAILLGITTVAVAEGLLAAAASGLLRIIAPVFVFLTVLMAFVPVYLVFPNADVTLREALPGAAFAAAGWTVLGRAFGIYAGLASTYAIYGALGAVFLVLTWLYAGSVLVVLGAVLNAVLAGHDREIDRIDGPDDDGPSGDRQLQSPRPRESRTEAMTDDATGVEEEPVDPPAESARTRDRSGDPAALREEIERLRDELEDVEERVESRTVRKESLEAELERYVRSRVRRSHARGWGPYLVLLYGTAMSIAAFYFLSGGWAVLAMFVVWTSTLGVYGLMVLIGGGISALGVPGRLRDRIGEWRS
ncbi:YihY/virulence factor BrkB family protein [Saliphagus infecundisoli]|uniref:YhjD/YihY/BrkB family envelope integrity protein n=1 Tax=Saliphagus infecundisoli TaxID=1849069 RepID=A0ABD5QEQ0_9EURY|nr:YihY/virulence factor BrkB family protein [Saliphagus infecundisoli]